MNSIFHSGLKYFFVLTIIIHIQSEKLNAQSTNPFTDSSIRARRDIIDVLFKYTKKYTEKRVQDTSKKLFFSLMPVSGGSNEQGVAISAISASFFTDDPQFTNLSNITFYPTTNFKSYFVFKVIPNIWLIRNNWNIAGKFEQARKLEDNYGIGANTSIDSLNPVNFNLSRINVVLSRRMFSNFYLGVGYAMDYFYNIEEEWDRPWPSFFARYPYGTSSESFSSGLILSLIHDNRKNAINSLSGLYANLSIRYNSHWMGSNYDWYSLVCKFLHGGHFDGTAKTIGHTKAHIVNQYHHNVWCTLGCFHLKTLRGFCIMHIKLTVKRSLRFLDWKYRSVKFRQ